MILLLILKSKQELINETGNQLKSRVNLLQFPIISPFFVHFFLTESVRILVHNHLFLSHDCPTCFRLIGNFFSQLEKKNGTTNWTQFCIEKKPWPDAHLFADDTASYLTIESKGEGSPLQNDLDIPRRKITGEECRSRDCQFADDTRFGREFI